MSKPKIGRSPESHPVVTLHPGQSRDAEWAINQGIPLYRIRVLSRWYALRRMGKLNDLRLKLVGDGLSGPLLKLRMLPCGSCPVIQTDEDWERTSLEEIEKRIKEEENASQQDTVRKQPGRSELGTGAESEDDSLQDDQLRRAVYRDRSA